MRFDLLLLLIQRVHQGNSQLFIGLYKKVLDGCFCLLIELSLDNEDEEQLQSRGIDVAENGQLVSFELPQVKLSALGERVVDGIQGRMDHEVGLQLLWLREIVLVYWLVVVQDQEHWAIKGILSNYYSDFTTKAQNKSQLTVH